MGSPSHGLGLGAMACASGHAWAWAKVQLNHQRPRVMTISLAPDPIAGFAWPGVEQSLKHRTTKRRNQRNNERTNEKEQITCNQHPRFLLNGSAAVRRTSMAGSLLFACQELTLTIATFCDRQVSNMYPNYATLERNVRAQIHKFGCRN